MSLLLDYADGLHDGIPEEMYHSRIKGIVSTSALGHLAKSPAHYLAWADGAASEEPSEAMAFGSALHCAVLEPARFAQTYTVQPAFGDCRKKENKAARDGWLLDHEGVRLLSRDDAFGISGIKASLAAHPVASRFLASGRSEVTALWTDPETQLRCRARADWYREDLALVLDLKTTHDASPTGFAKSVANYRYHWQEEIYCRGFAALGKPLKHFVFCAVEKTPPYAVALYTLEDRFSVLAARRVAVLMRQLREAIELDQWPGYKPETTVLSAPGWLQ